MGLNGSKRSEIGNMGQIGSNWVQMVQSGLKWVKMGSKWAQFTRLSTPNGPGSFLEKRVFDPFGTQFWSQNGPFSRHFGSFRGQERATRGSKRLKTACFGITRGVGSFLEKVFFLPRVDPGDPFWPPPIWAPSCTLPQHNEH